MVSLKQYFYRVIVPQQILALAAVVYLIISREWIWLIPAFISWFLMYVVGESIILHRYYSHKAFEMDARLAKVLSLFGTLGGFGSPLGFRALHVAHHAYSDTDKDPHSPHQSLWNGYLGWYTKPLQMTPAMMLSGRHLMKDAFYPWTEKHKVKIWWTAAAVLAVIDWKLCAFVMGLGGALGLHITCIGNSFGHRYGSRRFDTKDDSHNLWLASWLILAGGSVLQNNHHAHPTRYHNSHAWYEIDVGKWIIPLLATRINQ